MPDIESMFTCPECGGHRLEEVQTEVTSFSEILSVDPSGSTEYGPVYIDGDEEATDIIYQCAECGHQLDDIHDTLSLYLYLNKKERDGHNPS